MFYIGIIALVTFAQVVGAYFALKILEKKVYALSDEERIERFGRMMNIRPDDRYLITHRKVLIKKLTEIIENTGSAITPGIFLYAVGAAIAVTFALQAVITNTGIPLVGETSRGTSILFSFIGMGSMLYSTKFLFMPWYRYAMAQVMIPKLNKIMKK